MITHTPLVTGNLFIINNQLVARQNLYSFAFMIATGIIMPTLSSPDLDELRKGTDNQFLVIRANLGAINGTVTQLQGEVKKLSADLAGLESRLTVIESQPQEKLIEQVDSIHREVSE
jgi:hypothetical protein